jgi:RNA polymerase sigma-70 factor (ECF subfamily)
VSQEGIRSGAEPGTSGDAEEFGELFAACEGDVIRLCRKMLGTGAGSEDAASEIFLKARRAFHTYDRGRPFRSWLLSIASNHCIDQLRRRRTETRLFDDRDFRTEDLADPGPSPLRQTLRAEERESVVLAIESLPAKYRLPLVLRYFSDLDYQAMAGLLGVTRNQVGTLLFRAKRKLREKLAEGETKARERGEGGERR